MRNTGDEIERMMKPVNTEKFQFGNPTPYEVWLNTSNELKSMREELKESERKQEAESARNQKANEQSIAIARVSAIFSGISVVIALLTFLR